MSSQHIVLTQPLAKPRKSLGMSGVPQGYIFGPTFFISSVRVSFGTIQLTASQINSKEMSN